MSRPKPTVLLQSIDAKTLRAEQVLQSEAIFAVFYNARPINLRSLNPTMDDGTKYKKVSFSNPGHAHHLRDKLNRMFKTDKFSVVMLEQGVTLPEE